MFRRFRVTRNSYWKGPSKHTEVCTHFEGTEPRDYVGPLGTSGKPSVSSDDPLSLHFCDDSCGWSPLTCMI